MKRFNHFNSYKKMKISLLTLLVLGSTSLLAQTHQMTKHDGAIIDINFIKTDNNVVYYTAPSSTEEQSISKYAVATLVDQSKNTPIIVSEKIQLNGNSDYNKVIVLQKHQTIGLKESGVITSFYSGTKGESPISFSDNGKKRLKENAALRGAQFIVILSKKPKDLKAAIFTY